MKAAVGVFTAALLTALAGARGTPEPDPGIHKAFPMIVPDGGPSLAIEPPPPVSLNLEDAFRVGINIHNLGSVSNATIAEADRRAAEKYAHVYPGPERVGITRAVDRRSPSPMRCQRKHVTAKLSGHSRSDRPARMESGCISRTSTSARDPVWCTRQASPGLSYAGRTPARDRIVTATSGPLRFRVTRSSSSSTVSASRGSKLPRSSIWTGARPIRSTKGGDLICSIVIWT